MLNQSTMADFGAMIRELNKFEAMRISHESYVEFERHWVFYALQEKRYGQAFCEHFNIGNATPLYNFKDEKISRRWINDNHIKNE